ncbi:MAG: class I SAM-dependent methyltransferase [Bacteroidota bacterium]
MEQPHQHQHNHTRHENSPHDPDSHHGNPDHWNSIFSNKGDTELGWYENDNSQTFKFLNDILLKESDVIFLPGAGTSILVDELFKEGHRLILNDISDEALNKLRMRVGDDEKLTWLHHNIAKPLPVNTPEVDIWIDRAVLHFMLDEKDIQGYFDNLRSAVKPGGWVLLAEFSTKGAKKCAGLELHRYSITEMTRRMGSEFELIKNEEYTYINPAGSPRSYIYALFKRHHD